MSSSYLELPEDIQRELLTSAIAYQLVCADLARATRSAEGEIGQVFLTDAYQLVQEMTPASQQQVLAAMQRSKEMYRGLGNRAIVASVRVDLDLEQPTSPKQITFVLGAHALALKLAAEQIATLSVVNGTTGELVERLVMQGAELMQRCSPEELVAALNGIPGINLELEEPG